MSNVNPGRFLFAAGMAGLGLLSLLFHAFALQWQPVPVSLPFYTDLTYVSGAILLLAGLGLMLTRTSAWSGLVLGVFLAAWVLLLKIPEAVAIMPQVTKTTSFIGTILGIFEDTGLACGAWMLYTLSVADGATPAVTWLSGERMRLVVRVLFGVCCLEYGLSHFAFADFTASMIPGWIPERTALAWITGAGHFAAGLALVSGLLPRLAATCQAIMLSLFVLLVHVPMLIAGPASDAMQLDWTMLFVACGLAGTAWTLAWSLRDKPWGWKTAKAG